MMGQPAIACARAGAGGHAVVRSHVRRLLSLCAIRSDRAVIRHAADSMLGGVCRLALHQCMPRSQAYICTRKEARRH